MLEFQPLTLQHIDLLRGYFKKHPSRICDSTIGGTFLWRDYFRTQFAEADGSLFLRSVMPETGEYIYAVPMEGDKQAALLRLKAHCETEGHPLVLSTVAEEELPDILALLPDARVETIPEWADYLYLADSTSYRQRPWQTDQANPDPRCTRQVFVSAGIAAGRC